MPQNKKQHYVPRFFFRNFTEDENTIGIYNLEDMKFFRGPFKNLCAKDYFYSKDRSIEQVIGEVENKAAPVIRTIISGSGPTITLQDKMHLCMFLLLQHSRTIQGKQNSKEMTRQFSENVLKPCIAGDMKKAGKDPRVLDDVKITMKMTISFI